MTTAQVTDASPAAWFSQTPDRGAQDEIARQFLEVSKPDVILGGGEDWWYPAGNPGAWKDGPPADPDGGEQGHQGRPGRPGEGPGLRVRLGHRRALAAATGSKLLGLFANEELFQQRPEGQGDVYNPPSASRR